MKQKMLLTILVLAVITMFFSTAAAPRGLAFDSIRHVDGKGYVALFNPQGTWKQDDLWGFVVLPHNRQIDMDCNFRDDGKISCVIAGGISQFSSRMVKLVVYGYTFPVVIPPYEARTLEFDGFSYVDGKGYMAVFEPSGGWRQDDLWGFVVLPHDKQIDMDCNFRDDGKITCSVAGGISQYIGRPVKLVVYGYAFPTTVPPRP